VQRFNERQGFLVSATVHLLVLMIVARSPSALKQDEAPKPEPKPKSAVFLPPNTVLKELIPLRPRAAAPPPPRARAMPNLPEPTPPPIPPDVKKKDRISIGSEAPKEKEPLLLRRDEMIQAKKGRPDAAPSVAPDAPRVAAPSVAGGGTPEVPGAPGLRMPPGFDGARPGAGDDGARSRPGAAGPSIARSLQNLDQKLRAAGESGIVTGTGQQQMGPLAFDPEGADFTVWINHFKNEVYRNWNIPEPVLLGFRGHVDIEFTVDREGHLTAPPRLIKSSGTPALDRAAMNALTSATFLALPADYGPPRCTMNVSFFYNEGPRPS
jgi:TonB family protein